MTPPTAGLVLDRFRLDGKVAVVTGPTGVIGTVFSRALLEAGAAVVLIGRDEDRMSSLTASLPAGSEPVRWIVCDLSDEGAVNALAARFGEERVDVLVNNACPRPPTDESLDAAIGVWREVLDVGLLAPLVLGRAVAAGMRARGGGSIVNIGSQAAHKPYRWIAAYGAAKAGLASLTLYMAEAWGRDAVRCNLLLPSLMVSSQDESLRATLHDMGLDRRAALGRLGDPEEMAGPLIFLASDASSHVTGQTIVCGGDLFPYIDRSDLGRTDC